ncbi:MAG: hypothetical protein K2N26_07695, partial [Oscillospiraceae bacterium]|nr:hypothetical protein [Oscillospiraceae bacterium]
MAKNDTNEIELNAYGERIAPKPSRKQNDTAKNTASKKSAAKKTEGIFSKKTPPAPIVPFAGEKKSRQPQNRPNQQKVQKNQSSKRQQSTAAPAAEIHPATG